GCTRRTRTRSPRRIVSCNSLKPESSLFGIDAIIAPFVASCARRAIRERHRREDLRKHLTRGGHGSRDYLAALRLPGRRLSVSFRPSASESRNTCTRTYSPRG